MNSNGGLMAGLRISYGNIFTRIRVHLWRSLFFGIFITTEDGTGNAECQFPVFHPLDAGRQVKGQDFRELILHEGFQPLHR